MMKKTAAMMLAMALIAAFAGCAPQNTPAPSPSPAAVATPAASPVVSPEVTNNAEVGPNTQGNTDGVIEGFKEGEVVDADKLPDKVKTAIKEKYPEATIKTVTFATYENQQLYKILLQKTENDTTEEVVCHRQRRHNTREGYRRSNSRRLSRRHSGSRKEKVTRLKSGLAPLIFLPI